MAWVFCLISYCGLACLDHINTSCRVKFDPSRSGSRHGPTCELTRGREQERIFSGSIPGLPQLRSCPPPRSNSARQPLATHTLSPLAVQPKLLFCRQGIKECRTTNRSIDGWQSAPGLTRPTSDRSRNSSHTVGGMAHPFQHCVIRGPRPCRRAQLRDRPSSPNPSWTDRRSPSLADRTSDRPVGEQLGR